MTTPWTELIHQALNERIAALGVSSPAAAGTVSTVATDRLSVSVIRDGSTLAVPVKCLGHVWPRPDDRVLMVRVENPTLRNRDEPGPGQEWCIIGVTSRVVGSAPPETLNFALSTGTNTSASVVDLPGAPSFPWTKRYDDTPTTMFLSFTNFLSINNASVGGYLRFLHEDGTSTTFQLCEIENGALAARFGPAHWRTIPDAGVSTPLAAGNYTVNLRWARTAGAGTLNTASPDDHASALAWELGA